LAHVDQREILQSALAGAASHEIYVSNELSGDVSIVNGDTLKVETTLALGQTAAWY
jgi:YVTN family beta-propeller protein